MHYFKNGGFAIKSFCPTFTAQMWPQSYVIHIYIEVGSCYVIYWSALAQLQLKLNSTRFKLG